MEATMTKPTDPQLKKQIKGVLHKLDDVVTLLNDHVNELDEHSYCMRDLLKKPMDPAELRSLLRCLRTYRREIVRALCLETVMWEQAESLLSAIEDMGD
jgi:hypothetical protein